MLSTFKVKFELNSVIFRGLINGKEGKAAALPKFLDMLTLSQPEGGGGGTLCPPIGFALPKKLT